MHFWLKPLLMLSYKTDRPNGTVLAKPCDGYVPTISHHRLGMIPTSQIREIGKISHDFLRRKVHVVLPSGYHVHPTSIQSFGATL